MVERIHHQLTQEVPEIFAGQMELVDARALREYNITGKGVSVAVIDPEVSQYRAPSKSSPTPQIIEHHLHIFHGFGFAGLISYLLPKAIVTLHDSENPDDLEAALSLRSDVYNMSIALYDKRVLYANFIRSVVARGNTLVHAAQYGHRQPSPHAKQLVPEQLRPFVITVSGFNNTEAGKFNFYQTRANLPIDIFGPGKNVLVPSGGNTLLRMNGTSIAAAVISTAAATIRSLGAPPEAVWPIMRDTSMNVGGLRVVNFRNIIEFLKTKYITI